MRSYHKNHHENFKRIRLHKFDTGGWLAERLFKDYGKIKEILKNNKFVDVPLTDEVKQLLNNQAKLVWLLC